MGRESLLSKIKNILAALLCGAILGCAPAAIHSETAAPGAPQSDSPLQADRDVARTLISLLDERKLEKPSVSDFENTALREIITFTTPAGYRLKNRFLELGVALAQALSFSRDPQVRDRLVEAARWVHSPRVRSEALLALAALKDPQHAKFFREALLDRSVAIQFAAVEALQAWGLPEAGSLLLSQSNQNWSPLIRVSAAQAALRLGNQGGRTKLIEFLRDGNWLVRAMAARALGDLGRPEDADLLLSRLGPEQDNKFVLAEVCIAALKLTALRSGAPAARPPQQQPAAPGAPPRRRTPFELEPLVVTAPRLRLPSSQFVDVRIDNSLVLLLEKLATEPPPEQQVLDPVLEEVNNLLTPAGFNLKVRYSDLSFLLTEGLAGTRNFTLVQRLEDTARRNPNARVRAAALIALAYDKTRADTFIYRDALRDPQVVVRFAAVEALDVLGGPRTRSLLADAAQGDASRVVRVFAAQALRRSGDPVGREMLVQFTRESDWPLRAMAVHFLGELGETDDYHRILFQLNGETNNFVIAEGCLALMRLSP